MMLPFKPVGIDLPVDVNNVAFLQWKLPGVKNKRFYDLDLGLNLMGP